MRALPSSQVIGVWERGQEQDSTERALTLLASACPGKTREELAAYSIGRRDACLLALRQRMFAGDLNAFAECPRCGAPLEYSLAAAELRGRAAVWTEGPFAFATGGFSLELRVPNSTDLASAGLCRSVEEARRTVARRCVRGGGAAVEELPEAVLSAVAGRLAEADPGADVPIDLRCAACGEAWQVVFDIASYLWAEIHTLAKRLLREVHVLARSYGWRERDILAMSAARRNFYLEMAT